MNPTPKNFLIASLVASALLTACGGGSDDGAGQLSEFQVSPDGVDIQSSLTTCPAMKAGEFLIVGGAAPYRIYSPYDPLSGLGVTFGPPGSASATHQGSYTVANRNERFAVFIEGCFDPATVTITDDLRRVTTIEISYAASGAN